MKPGGDAGLFVCAPAVLHKAMRSALSGFLICGLVFALSGPSFAATPDAPGFIALNAMLPAQPGNKACYVRSYETAHLRAHHLRELRLRNAHGCRFDTIGRDQARKTLL